MSLVDSIEEQEKRLSALEKVLDVKNGEKVKKVKIKIPGFLVRGVKKEDGVSVALWLGANHKAEFKKAVFRDGLIYVGDQSYGYEEGGVYQLKNGRKLMPFIVVFAWRLTMLGGSTDEAWARSRDGNGLVNGEELLKVAEVLGVTNFGQLSMVRRLEQAEVDKLEKKKGNYTLLIWVVVIGIVGYLLFKMFGGG